MSALGYFTILMWRSERKWVLAGIFTTLLASLSAIALLALSGWFITAAGIAGAIGAGLTFDFFRPSAGIRFFALFRTATRYGERITTHDATLRFLTVLRAQLFRSIALTKGKSKKFRNGELLQRLTADLESIDALFLRLVLPLLTAAAVVLILSLSLFFLSPAFPIALGAVAAVFFIALFVAGLLARKASRKLALGTEALRVRAIDLTRAQTDLIFSGGLKTQRDKIERAVGYLAAAGKRIANVDALTTSVFSLLAASLLVAALLLGGSALATGEISAPVLAMLVIGAFALGEVFNPLRRGAIETGRIMFSANRVEPLTRPAPVLDERVISKGIPFAVSVSGLSFKHSPEAKPLLSNFSLNVEAGERIALCGKSGCGKSTLLSLVAGQFQPVSGRIVLGSQSEFPLIGYLTQETELFAGSIAENLRIAAPMATDDELWRALDLVELGDKVRSCDKGMQFKLGEAGKGFSGGEQRRLALARLLLRRPQIWLLDEPTAGLDDALACRVLANLRDSFPNSTWIVAAHHPREVAAVERTIWMQAGG